ncbi:MAG TPA: hypothetical protein VGF23_26310 [Gaiellaceae bacterium]|jgi:hypothetical protein
MRPELSTSRRGRRLAPRAWAVTVVAATAIAASMVLVAVLDHRHKNAVMYRLEVDEWYCSHTHTRCFSGRHSWDVERRWNTRESAYVGVIAAMGGLAMVTVFLRIRRGRGDV